MPFVPPTTSTRPYCRLLNTLALHPYHEHKISPNIVALVNPSSVNSQCRGPLIFIPHSTVLAFGVWFVWLHPLALCEGLPKAGEIGALVGVVGGAQKRNDCLGSFFGVVEGDSPRRVCLSHSETLERRVKMTGHGLTKKDDGRREIR